MTEPLSLAVVVVSLNTRELLERCLVSVEAAQPAELVVVDNGSTDGSSALVRRRFPEARLIRLQTNAGYGGAANQGIAASSAPAVLLLNSDTVVAPDALSSLGGYLADHATVAIAGPRLINPDGTLQRSAHPYLSAGDTILAETGLHLLVRRVPGLRERFLRTWSHDRPRRVPSVLGAALAIRRSAFDEVGGFDPAFFMYGEESDLCRRLEQAGYETHYAPVTVIVHIRGATTRQQAAAMARELIISRRIYLRRYERPRAARRVLALLRAITAARLVRDQLRLGVTRDADRRATLRAAIASRRSLLAEHGLWSA